VVFDSLRAEIEAKLKPNSGHHAARG
jgi:hypothetical protein